MANQSRTTTRRKSNGECVEFFRNQDHLSRSKSVRNELCKYESRSCYNIFPNRVQNSKKSSICCISDDSAIPMVSTTITLTSVMILCVWCLVFVMHFHFRAHPFLESRVCRDPSCAPCRVGGRVMTDPSLKSVTVCYVAIEQEMNPTVACFASLIPDKAEKDTSVLLCKSSIGMSSNSLPQSVGLLPCHELG
jgi:hypothetical protein